MVYKQVFRSVLFINRYTNILKWNMWTYNNYATRAAIQNELLSDLWIEQNIPGGLDSKLINIWLNVFIDYNCKIGPLGRALDNAMGGNPNPTWGQMYGSYIPVGGYGYGTGYGYGYRRW